MLCLSGHSAFLMADRITSLVFFSTALVLGGVLGIILLAGFIEWLQTGDWHTRSVLRAAYDARLIRARWFLSVDWGWRIHEVLDHIPVLALLGALIPVSWAVGVYFDRR